MTSLGVPLLVVPALDHGLKRLVLNRLGSRTIGLGAIGAVKVVRSQIWMVRARGRANPALIWGVWTAAAVALTALSLLAPSFSWFAGLMLGGALSHLLETSTRGFVCDYVCLRFWPAFNLADVALTVGAVGLLVELAAAVQNVLA